MKKLYQLKLITLAISAIFISACGDAQTNIVEKDPIVVEDEHDHDDDDDHDHDDGYTIDSLGRLAVLAGDSNEASFFDLDNNELLDTFTLNNDSNTLSASPGFRYAVIANRTQDYLGFIGGGMWREDHAEHLHDYEQGPAFSSYELTSGSRPTHLITHDGQLAIFYDGDAETGTPASVEVLTDNDITNTTTTLTGINYGINMHGVAEPRGEHLLSTIRRDDISNTSNAKVLPDQVGVYHLHDGNYELEQTLEITCPDLHGAAQNHDYVVFGCGDGVLIAHQQDDVYSAQKVVNIDAVGDQRIGTLYGHKNNDTIFGIAAGHDGSGSVLLSIHSENAEMEEVEWQLADGASAVSYSFSASGEHFLILDSLGFLNVLTVHDHDGEMHWELAGQVDITQADVTTMPEGMSFSMTVAQSGQFAYIADPIAQHIVQVHLEDLEIESELELTFPPASITWLGIAQEIEDEDHDH
ncbi:MULTISPECIES: 5-methyltetrahydrofolate--homocysteine methyltransferase [unclassified Pseudoalteromonas]|uniref:5-methyltetrahydrofolate--homocysteine methyltransferase n=1 Tax=unclassified Pseudoalteromonas TaxID=194690 RepID=UPI000CBCCB9B|nr:MULTISPECIES: 5-methyltetrahydrofolate--homocysteine methyltransferase [unclassified Pseudoalteromonas]MBH0047639.1 5-methyltetrahydrofolate--homocysteine methyltransferase [Pseudoalteromonas sp. NZS11_1]PLT27455.1 5-methyltetrahydrofolate--homocysteine methyltransferase [Pseudoalteromonas sp. MelDa3]